MHFELSAPHQQAASAGTRDASVLVVDDDELIRDLLSSALAADGYDVALADDGASALARVAETTPDLIVSDIDMPVLDGFGLVDALRATEMTRSIPLIFLTAFGSSHDAARGLDRGADDYVAKPFDVDEVRARVRAKLERPPIPAEFVARDVRTGLMSERAFAEAADRELDRSRRGGRHCALACLQVVESASLRDRLGRRAVGELSKQIAALLSGSARPLDLLGRDADGRFMLLLPETGAREAQQRLDELAVTIAATSFVCAGEAVRVTPATGYAVLAPGTSAERLWREARTAAGHAASQLDLCATVYRPSIESSPSRRRSARARVPGARLAGQIAITYLLGVLAPFLAYVVLARAGLEIAPTMYVVVVVALLVTAVTVWTEGVAATRPAEPPAEPAAAHPPASAVIAAYLPNEAATIAETVEAFLRVDYPGPLQVLLAYNTPREMPIEAVLREIAARDPRFVPYRVHGSTSKSQNVNAALAHVTGEFVGVFDADHHPDRGAFRRAWRWLSHGYDVVQGHCVIRNGDVSWVSRLVAVEFESMYAVSHPGRARLHGFGIFGGSNGYWRTDVLRRTRMRGSMLTEDIDSSLRALEEGWRIASDPGLISRELAPTTLSALANQRMRWAQGWFQVSLRHVARGLRSRRLTVRNKIGLFYLLPWRELYPWLSLQMFPIIAYFVWKAGSVAALDWLVPIFVLTTLLTLAAAPGQSLFAYRLAAPEIKRHKRWLLFLLASAVLYSEAKNVVTRVSQLKEAIGEREWKVTPRAEDAREPR